MLFEHRLVRVALLDPERASRVEPAARRRMQQVWRDALDRPQALVPHRVDARHAAQQRPGVGVLGVLEDLLHRSLLDDLACVHDDHPRAQARDHAHVVRDHDHGSTELSVQVAEQFQDLRLHRDVEGGCRLVGDQDLRRVRQSHRDHRPLPHAPAQLVWEVLDSRLCGWYPHLLQQVDSAGMGLGLRAAVGQHRLVDLKAGAEDRVERALRVLEDHRDIAPAYLADLVIGELQQVLVLEEDLAPHHPTRLRHEAQQREGCHRLAASGLPDDAEALALMQVEAHTVDGRDDAPVGHELSAQIAHLQNRSGQTCCL